jgi:tetratricopeptide (TPR) repeat protein
MTLCTTLVPILPTSNDYFSDRLLGEGNDLKPLKRLIVERTESNPFFIEEMYQALIEQGVIIHNGAVTLAKPLGDIRVPPTVQAILASRIDRLAAPEKELLQTLAVFGREFPVGLVKRVTLKPEDELERMFSRLQAGEFIYEQPAAGDTEYIFKHALTQEVAYNSLLSERRKTLHQLAGQALESIFTERLDDHLDELARHYHRSGNAAKAVEYLDRAGRQAMSRSAYREAEEPLNTALVLLSTLPASIERDWTESSLRLNLGVCTIYNVPGAYMLAETLESLELARGLCEKFGKDALRCDVLSALAFLYANRLESEKKVQTTCEELLEIATQMNDTDMIGRGLFWSAFTQLWRGYFTTASERLERAYELPIGAPSKQELAFGGWQTLTRSMSALTLLILGHPEKAALRNQEALALARERKNHESLIPTLFWSAFLNVLLRQPEAAYRHVEEGLRLAREEGLAALVAVNAFWRGYTLVQLGQMEEGLAELTRYGAEMVQFVRTPLGSVVFPALADGYLKARQRDQGLQTVAQELEIVQDNGSRFGEPEVRRLKGQLLLLDSEATSEAERCFREAIEIARHQGAKWWELRATTSLARLLAEQDHRDQARAMLADIYHWFTEGFDTADLKDAEALLAELSAYQ